MKIAVCKIVHFCSQIFWAFRYYRDLVYLYDKIAALVCQRILFMVYNKPDCYNHAEWIKMPIISGTSMPGRKF